jgi:hypothetical protein
MCKSFNQLSLSTTPLNENCAHVGQDTYYTDCKIEAKVFIAQLKRVFGDPPPSAYFKVVFYPYDFGSYCDVVIRYDTRNQEALDYAYTCEDEIPQNWDAAALKELKEKGYSLLK